jgi:hypothetical protein
MQNRRCQQKPLMVSFSRNTNDLRKMGMIAWGGTCVDSAGIKLRDLALRLGSEKPWIETLYQIVAKQNPAKLILVDPDFSVFLGDSFENENQFLSWLKSQNICLNVVQTNQPDSAAA